ncbi:MAG: glycosyltransferase family 39 protein [Gammaproteobacteria bacterium]|nr:glycosyltransferase family 39 protein [Gammaproteobacteria bacterium]
MRQTIAQKLWGENAKFLYLFFTALVLLFCGLGSKDIWTQEHRWADIVSAMFAHHDFLHPTLNTVEYYDKPLLSYWLIALIAKITGSLSTWALRLPSALAGFVAVCSIYTLGSQLKNRSLGLLAGWMLVTTFYFLFWARTSSADMLNLAGTLLAITWFYEKKSCPSFFNYFIFFFILAIAALCKGLIAPAIVVLAVLTKVVIEKSWRIHLRPSLFLALIPALILYYLPFWASVHFGSTHYNENGLTLVWRENVLRYFEPFDHKGPIYTYFIFLPVYLLPWTMFFIPALFFLRKRWEKLSTGLHWLYWTTLVLFLFLTLSGSRRNYYVLPLVPFAILITADWVLTLKQKRFVGIFTVLSASVMIIFFAIAQPIWYKIHGVATFAETLQREANQIHPWSDWKIVLLDPESKIRFYLHLPEDIAPNNLAGEKRAEQTTVSLLHAWPMLSHVNSHKNIIYISRVQYKNALQPLFKHYRVVQIDSGASSPIAFLPSQSYDTNNFLNTRKARNHDR